MSLSKYNPPDQSYAMANRDHLKSTNRYMRGAGSSFELPGNHRTTEKYRRGARTDMDLMIYNADLVAWPKNKNNKAGRSGKDHVFYEPYWRHPGYVIFRLPSGTKVSRSNEFSEKILESKYLPQWTNNDGPASRCKLLDIKWRKIFLRDVPDLKLYQIPCDLVRAINSPVWPQEADDFKIRNRRYTTPSTETIKACIDYGVDFVAAPINEQGRRLSDSFRYSFSMAELLIISKWSTRQRIVYRVLKTISKSSSLKVIKSYHFKTFLLWAVEKNPPEFWKNTTEYIVRTLIGEIQSRFKERNLLHYFIKRNNLLYHLELEDIIKDISSLQSTMEKLNLSALINHCEEVEYFTYENRNFACRPNRLCRIEVGSVTTARQLKCFINGNAETAGPIILTEEDFDFILKVEHQVAHARSLKPFDVQKSARHRGSHQMLESENQTASRHRTSKSVNEIITHHGKELKRSSSYSERDRRMVTKSSDNRQQQLAIEMNRRCRFRSTDSIHGKTVSRSVSSSYRCSTSSEVVIYS